MCCLLQYSSWWMQKEIFWNSWPGVQTSPRGQAVQVPETAGSGQSVWAGCPPGQPKTPTDGVKHMMLQWWKVGKAALPPTFPKITLPVPPTPHLYLFSRSRIPETLSSYSSTSCQGCSDCAAMGNLTETQDRQDSPNSKKIVKHPLFGTLLEMLWIYSPYISQTRIPVNRDYPLIL